jgi:hypothetical protein
MVLVSLCSSASDTIYTHMYLYMQTGLTTGKRSHDSLSESPAPAAKAAAAAALVGASSSGDTSSNSSSPKGTLISSDAASTTEDNCKKARR